MSSVAVPELKAGVQEQRIPAGYSMAGVTFVLAALSWIGPFSIDTYLPSLPSISQTLEASQHRYSRQSRLSCSPSPSCPCGTARSRTLTAGED